MTLAGQYLLLQVLIVLGVLVAVGAISVAQTARTFERSEVRPALSAAENLAANPVVRERIATAEPVRPVRAGLGGRVRRGPTPAPRRCCSPTPSGWCWSPPTPRRSGGPGRRGPEPGAGRRLLDRHPGRVGPAPWWSPRCRCTPSGPARSSGWPRSAARSRRCGAGSATWSPTCWSTSGVASVLGLGGSLLLSRRVKRQTLGMEPAEIAGLVEHREALVHGVKEGVVAHRRAAAGHRGQRQRPPAAGAAAATASAAGSTSSTSTTSWSRCSPAGSPSPDRLVLVGDRVLALNRRPMRSHGQVIGSVTTLRDRTELSALESELGTSRATSDTLRAQTHEFANQLHTISGLLQLEEYDEVVRFVDGVRLGRSLAVRRGHLPDRRRHGGRAADRQGQPGRRAGRGAAAATPARRVGKVYGALSRDLTTVVGNLVDNALDAVAAPSDAAAGRRTPGRRTADAIVVTVADSGPGRAGQRGGVPAGLDHQGRSGPRRRGPRLRPGADPAGLPAPRRRRDACTTTAARCSPRPCRPASTGTRRCA